MPVVMINKSLSSLLMVLSGLLSLATVSGAAENSLILKAVARVDGEVLVRDVAVLTGPEADKLGSLVLLLSPTKIIEIDQVRRAAIASGARVGQIRFSGSSCRVEKALRPEMIEDAADERAEVKADTGQAKPTQLRDIIIHAIAGDCGLHAESVRVTFDQTDSKLLDRVISTQKADQEQVTVSPAVYGERSPLTIRVYAQQKLTATHTLRATVTVERECVVTKTVLSRGQVIKPSDVQIERRWLPINLEAAPADAVEGAAAATKLAAGSVVERRDVQASLAVKRGDLVMVDSIVGGVVVRARARVLANARVGEQVTAQSVPWNQEIIVMIISPGNATAIGPAPHKARGASVRAQK